MIMLNDVLARLKDAGYSAYRLRKDGIMSESTIQALRQGDHVTTKTIDAICTLLNCQPGDIMEYIPDNKEEKINV